MEVETSKSRKHKRPYRSSSEDPSDSALGLKRTKKSINNYLTFETSSLSTRFFPRPFIIPKNIEFTVQGKKEFELLTYKKAIPFLKRVDALNGCQKIIEISKIIMQKKDKKKPEKTLKKTLEDQQKEILEEEFRCGNQDFQYLSTITKFSRQQIRNMWIKFNKDKLLIQDYRNQRHKLNNEHCEFIKQFFSKSDNFDKNIMDLHTELVAHFGFDKKFVSFWTLYDYVHKLKLSYKMIKYKISRANIPSTKLKRSQIAKNIMSAHLNSFDFVYIDEISFNLELRISKGWCLKGTNANSTKPPKSKNYSVIVAMDVDGYVGIKVVKGGVKGPEFISFMVDICKILDDRIRKKKTIFFMDNASIHRSKDFMQVFAKHYNILYNAAYTPQLNPIEFSFSRLKYQVKKAKPISEIDLVAKIL